MKKIVYSFNILLLLFALCASAAAENILKLSMREDIDFDAIWEYGTAHGWEATRMEALEQVQIDHEEVGQWLAVSARVIHPPILT